MAGWVAMQMQSHPAVACRLAGGWVDGWVDRSGVDGQMGESWADGWVDRWVETQVERGASEGHQAGLRFRCLACRWHLRPGVLTTPRPHSVPGPNEGAARMIQWQSHPEHIERAKRRVKPLTAGKLGPGSGCHR